MACTSLTNGLLVRKANSSTAHGELSKEAAGDVIEMGDFLIDVAERRATLRGRELDLTSAEFDLLVFFVGHPKSFVTHRTPCWQRIGRAGRFGKRSFFVS